VAGTLRSFRTSRLSELIAFGRDQAYVGARVQRSGLERIYELTVRERGRRIRLDGKAVRPISRYFGDFNVVLFAPEDLQVPRGSPGDRRRFFDRAVFNRRPQYLAAVQAYDKVVKSRNVLLRDLGEGRGRRGTDEMLEVYDQQLAELGARVMADRLEFLVEIGPRFAAAFEQITHTGLPVEAVYATAESLRGLTEPEALAAGLASLLAGARRADLARGTTSVGPHRDDLVFLLADRPASAYASQGQLRALVLAWKTAELDLLAATHGDDPILLLDDVSSELDAARNEYLFEFLRSRRNQCFITTTHPRHVLLTADRLDYRVSAGLVEAEKTS
jgi:DNA replication and repair protein RecF